MSDDVLERLKSELERHLEILEKSEKSVRDLKLAISAIEESRSAYEGPNRKTRRGRGFLKRALLDCIRSGIGDRAKIAKRLADAGVESNAGSVSNAIYRAQVSGDIRWDETRKIYVLNEEGPVANATRPLQLNGAAVGAA